MPPRPKKRTTEAKSNNFLNALRFVGSITKDEGTIYETHVCLQNGWVTAFNGLLAAGQKITEDISACPNNKLMIEALSKCGEHLSVTQLDNNRLSIKSEKFKAIVPCVDAILLQSPIPDNSIAEINDDFKTAIDAVSVLANDNGDRIYQRSILIQNGSVVATTGTVIFEFWHGISLPTMAIPKSFVTALLKCNKKLSKFGFSNSSVTFYFEDESWLRTQLYAEAWPDIKNVLNCQSKPWPFPVDFYKGLDAIAPFSPDGFVRFEKNLLCSHNVNNDGATYEVEGIPQGFVFSIKQLNLIKSYVKEIDWFVENNNIKMTMFFGEKIRGCIAGRN